MTEFPDDENGQVLRDMAAEGDDLSIAREIDFSLLFADQHAAEAFCRMFAEEGYDVGLGKWESDPNLAPGEDKNIGKWDVRVTRDMVPDHAAITAFEVELQTVATPLGGYNDGWGCFQAEA